MSVIEFLICKVKDLCIPLNADVKGSPKEQRKQPSELHVSLMPLILVLAQSELCLICELLALETTRVCV